MAPKKNYTPQQMGWAIEAVRKGAKISDAANKFNVPRITLHNKITGKSPVECLMGPSTILSKEEENILEDWIIDMSNKHIPITKEELLDSVQRIIVDKKQETPFTNNRPGKKWYSSFMKRHPTIAERTAQNLCTARDNVTQDDIEKWFSEVETDLKERGLKKQQFAIAPVLKTAIEKLTVETIKNGFRAGGLYPFGPELVDMSKIKSQNRQNIDSTRQREFLRTLENKIEATLSCAKLKLFKDLYYKSHLELENLLPNEDESLYLIWASSKQILDQDVRNEVSAPTNSVETSNHVSETDDQNENASPKENESIGVLSYYTNDSKPSASSRNICLAKKTSDLNTSNAGQEDLAATNNSLPQTNETIAVLFQKTNNSEPSTSTLNTSNERNAKQGNLEVIDNSLQKRSAKTPMKINNPGTSNYVIPSPFKRSLFWPETDEITKNKKRKLKEKIPFTITSPAWKAYNTKKEEEKRKQIEEKELRAKQREENKMKKLNKKKKVSNKRKNRVESSETEDEVIYAESDESVLTEGSESDDAPLSRPTLLLSRKKLSKGNYVIVLYEGQHFPGVIENTNKNEFEVSTMTFSTGNTYKWPDKPDKMWYQRKNIVEQIYPPSLINKRGFYAVKEMKKYSNFTS